MTPADFRRIALSLEGVEEYDHAGFPAFRVGGRKFASLASQTQGYGTLMLRLEQQAAFVDEMPEVFLPIAGGWGRMGHTHIRLAAASEDVRRVMEMLAMWSGVRHISIRSRLPEVGDSVFPQPNASTAAPRGRYLIGPWPMLRRRDCRTANSIRWS